MLNVLTVGIPNVLPEYDAAKARSPQYPHAPLFDVKNCLPTEADKKLAVKNALRYFPAKFHATLAPEFFSELMTYGHIYMYRFKPTAYEMKAHPISEYPAKCTQAAAIMLMIMNNLDPQVAQYPEELVTYGGNGSVFSNWAQYLLTMKYLSEMTDEQTLVMYSGHPQGLFPSFSKDSPRVVITNGLTIPNFSLREDYNRGYALGVTQFGQMTAGSYCYIGPQGIVHGTTLTVLNAFRKYLHAQQAADMKGKVYVTSGLGGMSGAQPKAGDIIGCITVVAEVNWNALQKRYNQGWVKQYSKDLEACMTMIKKARESKETTSIAYHGNIVDLWERLAQEEELLVELGSDQTSLHNPYNGGYYPAGISFEDANALMKDDPDKFKDFVQESLRRQVTAINKLVSRGMRFYDYGNSFLLEAGRAQADIFDKSALSGFKYPSYVQDIMGDIFSLGFGPFRWVCLSNDPKDLSTTDKIAAQVITSLKAKAKNPKSILQFDDNYLWITKAEHHKLVVGSQARILYSDAKGRIELALAFNEAVKNGTISAPIVLSRDHHDVSGADSPYRETSNVYDGSNKLADMSVQTVIGNSFRGATWVALHNGGGTGWGMAMNCGFGMVLDGSDDAAKRAKSMLLWDVYNGIARRAWASNENANTTIELAMEDEPTLKVTVAQECDSALLDSLLQ